MKKFTLYDESTASPASDHTEYNYSKPTVTVSKTVLWMMLIAFILLVAVVVYYRYRGEPDKYWFPNHSEIPKNK